MLPGWQFSLHEPHKLRLVGSVDFPVVSMTPLAPSVFSPPLPQNHPSSAQCLDAGLCINFQELLGEAALMRFMQGPLLCLSFCWVKLLTMIFFSSTHLPADFMMSLFLMTK